MDTPDERERMNRTGCARCHTAQGYQRVILAGEASAAPYAEAEGLTCGACHLNVEGPEAAGALRAGAARDACRGCHDELVTNQPNSLSWCSQWGIFEGTGGSEETRVTTPTSAHSSVENGCVACHMAPAATGLAPEAVGGHTFRVMTKDVTPGVFNPSGCVECHEGITSKVVRRSQEEVRALLASLAALLPQRPDPEDPENTVPRFPADPSLTPLQRRASHNYWLVEKDGSLGVHNPGYTRALLEASIAEFGGARQK
jgi:hypothetical protein